jgi:hypothetical protein
MALCFQMAWAVIPLTIGSGLDADCDKESDDRVSNGPALLFAQGLMSGIGGEADRRSRDRKERNSGTTGNPRVPLLHDPQAAALQGADLVA